MKRRFLSTLMALCLALSLLPATALAAEGETTADDEGANIAADTTEYVAQVGEQTYTTLQDALTAEGDTITLLSDVSLTGTEVLNLTGKTIQTKGNTIYVRSGADVTIAGNGTVENDVVPTAKTEYHDLFVIESGGRLTIENGTFNTKSAQALNIVGTAIIEDGTFSCTASNVEIGSTDHTELQYSESKSMFYVAGGTLHFKNGAINAAQQYVPRDESAYIESLYGIYVTSGAKVTLGDEGSASGPSISSGYAALGLNNTTSNPPQISITIYGGTLEAGISADQDGNSLDVKQNAVMYISGAVNLEIYGGTFKGTNPKTDLITIPYKEVGAEVTISGGEFNATECDKVFYSEGTKAQGSGNNTLTITNGNFNYTAENFAAFADGNTFDDFITGGSFSSNVSEYVPNSGEGGGMTVSGDDGKFTVTISDNAVAEIDGVGYATLQDAVDAVPKNTPTTITLRRDTSGSGIKVPGSVTNYNKNITFDLGGNTYTVTSGVGSTGTETNGFQLLAGNTVAFENGTIAAAPAEGQRILFLIQNYSNLTLENVTLDGTGLQDDSGYNYTLSNNNGEIALNAGTRVIARADGEIAMDVCWAKSYQDGARVTINEGAVIEGDVELGLWGQDAYEDNQSVLTVNGGTITGELKLDQTISADEVDETIEALESNIAINGGSFGSAVDAYVGTGDQANAKVQSGSTHSYYTSLEDAQKAAKPGDKVTDLNATEADQVTLTLDYNDGVTADSEYTVTANTQVTLPTPTRNGYDFRYWSNGSATYNGGDSYTVTDNVTLTAQWSAKSQGGSSSDSGPATYSPTLDVSDGGTIKVSPRTPEAGDKVTITPDPDSGYEVDQVTVTDRDGDEIRVTANRDGTYTFTQPRGRVTIEVTFVRETGETTFSDVSETYWAYDEIEWAYDNGYVNGTSASTFAPGASISRQQVWMILARLSGGSPADMAAAREWAMANDISDGTNPGNAVTRQQLAALLFRFAQANGYDSGDRAALTGFPDAGSVASYAVEALQWATASGVINGTSQGTLNPAGTATRAQFAVMLYRFWNGL